MQTMTKEQYEAAFAEATRRAEQKKTYRETHAQWVERITGRARAQHVQSMKPPRPEPVRRCTGCGSWEHLERPCACGGSRR